MGNKDDSRALLYVGLGMLAAVGAGYLVWRYALTDTQKEAAKAKAREVAAAARETAGTLMDRAASSGVAATALEHVANAKASGRHAASRAARSLEGRAQLAADRLE